MIILATGNPRFRQLGEQTVMTLPSGKGDKLEIALSRNQLCHLLQHTRMAVDEAFSEPQPELADLVPITSQGGA